MESTTDPDSGQLSKEGKPDGFHYSEHRTVDSKRNVIVNIHITPANINDIYDAKKDQRLHEHVHTPPLYYTRTAGKLHLKRRKTTVAPVKSDTIPGETGH